MKRHILMMAAIVMIGHAAAAGEFISDNDASLNLIGPPVWNTSLGNGTLLTDSHAGDQLYQYCWFYRTPNYNQNRYFSYLDTPIESWSGDTATITYLDAGPGVAGQPWSERFDAEFDITIIDGEEADQVRVICNLTLHNPNPGTVTYELFNIVDLDISGTLSDDLGVITSPSEVRGRYTEQGSSNYAEVLGLGATAYEVNQGFLLRNKLNSVTPSDLGNTTSFSGDAAIAMQWTITLEPEKSITIKSGFSMNQPAVAEIPCAPGDVNCDAIVDLLDVGVFVGLLLEEATPCGACAGDLNGDNAIDGSDIGPFVELLLAGA